MVPAQPPRLREGRRVREWPLPPLICFFLASGVCGVSVPLSSLSHLLHLFVIHRGSLA
jgi:hypothetical protein